jgi:hypothetical protein
MSINYNQKFKRNQNIFITEVETDTMIMNLETDKFYAMSDVATLIWSKTQQPFTLEEIIKGLEETFPDTPKDQLHEDCIFFLEDLVKNKLVIEG